MAQRYLNLNICLSAFYDYFHMRSNAFTQFIMLFNMC